jgi:hypothetical protein
LSWINAEEEEEDNTDRWLGSKLVLQVELDPRGLLEGRKLPILVAQLYLFLVPNDAV